MHLRETELSGLMCKANAGDEAAYAGLLRELVPVLRTLARRAVARGANGIDAEDIVQETLIAIHLKRHTWIATEPIGPWLRAIVRYKLIDALRRRGNRVHIPVHDLEDILPAAEAVADPPMRDLERHLPQLPPRQRDVLQAIALNGQSISGTATQLAMSEGAVRVALHRGVASLAQIFRGLA